MNNPVDGLLSQVPIFKIFTYMIFSGKHIAGFTQKKASAWQPQWTKDEALCYLRSPNNEIVVYKVGNGRVIRFDSTSLENLMTP